MSGLLNYPDADIWERRFTHRHIQPGDRVAIRSVRPQDWIAIAIATWRLGACLCPLNPKWPKSYADKLLDLLDVDYIADTDERRVSRYPKTEGPSVFVCTSGKEPKIAVITLQALVNNAIRAIDAVDLKQDDTWALTLPLNHVGGIGIVLRCLLAQAHLVFSFNDPSITHISCVPTHLYRQTPRHPKLKCVLVGGAPLGHLPKQLPIIGTYGMTETSSMVLAKKNPTDLYLGEGLGGREIRLDADGQIWIRGDTLFNGYWVQGRLTLPFDENGWFATGDLAVRDAKRGIAIVGRKDRQFIVGGENVQPEEIEAEILKLPGVVSVRVDKEVDLEYGFCPVAYIESSGAWIDWRAALEEALPKYKIPIRYDRGVNTTGSWKTSSNLAGPQNPDSFGK
jgi:O-succinylbenzoic acid--CoA ligase